MKSYMYEPDRIPHVRLIAFAIAAAVLVAAFLVLSLPSGPPQNIYERIDAARTFVAAHTIYICAPEDRQIQNMGLLADSRYINIPINPTIREAQLDGLMAQKTVLDGRVLYKVELPIEINISSITLDMAGGGLVYLFIENADGKRVWERHERLSPQRYNTTQMSNLTVFH